jgi:Arc/MetJ-type ribon-helix-helix transcriptional regulator
VRERGQDRQAYREDAAGRHGAGGDEVLQRVAAEVADALQEFGVTGAEYDKCMKRITVSLPDELAEKVRRAAGGERRVSSYVAAALEDYGEREKLEEVLAGWNAETPVPDEVRQQVRGELDRAGLTGRAGRDDRLAG